MKRHMENARGQLGSLASLASKTEADERGILGRAETRLAEVGAALDRLRPGVEGAPTASQDRYLDLVHERGQLHTIIAKAQAALDKS